MAKTLQLCAEAYREFCQRYKPKPKPERKQRWGSKLLKGLILKGKPKSKSSPGQTSLPWDTWERPTEEIHRVARQFVGANCYDPTLAMTQFEPDYGYQVTDRSNADPPVTKPLDIKV